MKCPICNEMLINSANGELANIGNEKNVVCINYLKDRWSHYIINENYRQKFDGKYLMVRNFYEKYITKSDDDNRIYLSNFSNEEFDKIILSSDQNKFVEFCEKAMLLG